MLTSAYATLHWNISIITLQLLIIELYFSLEALCSYPGHIFLIFYQVKSDYFSLLLFGWWCQQHSIMVHRDYYGARNQWNCSWFLLVSEHNWKNKEKKHLWSRESWSGILFSARQLSWAAFQTSPACILHSKPAEILGKVAPTSGENRWRESREQDDDVVRKMWERDQNLEAVYVTTTAGCCHFFCSSPTPVESSFIIQKVNFEWVESDLFTEEKTAFMTFRKMLNFLLEEPCRKYSDCHCDWRDHKYLLLEKQSRSTSSK